MPASSRFVFALLAFCLLVCRAAMTQHSPPDTVAATFTEEKIILDGVLAEPAWQTAVPITPFHCRPKLKAFNYWPR